VPESEDFALSLALVDAALYQAKQNGRNRVVNWEE
jgi:PleD family two-component response regulator